MNILITGGTGFVGQYLIKELNKLHCDIFVIGRKKPETTHIDISRFKNVNIKYGVDITHYDELEKHFKGMDLVINLAGYVSFNQSEKKKLLEVNYHGALNVLKACEKHKVKKLIHVSSTAALGFFDGLINENFSFSWDKYKKCVYSYSKYLPNRQIKESSLDTVIVYPSLVLGPGDQKNTYKYIQAIKDKRVPFNLPGKGSCVDVRDLASAMILLIKKDFKNDSIIIANENYSFKRMNEIIARVAHCPAPKITLSKKTEKILTSLVFLYEKLRKNPIISYETVFMGYQNRCFDISRLSGLGFRPKYTLEQTIKDSYKWIQKTLTKKT